MALYPPIVASSMPAFNAADGYVRIYFTLSNYTSIQSDSIKAIHISVRDQTSNNNKVADAGGIIVKPFENLQTEEDKILNRYHVDIEKQNLIDKDFIIDKIYKVQLRLSTVSTVFSNIDNIANRMFFTDNVYAFSEWSTVCIIKPILAPVFYIN